MSTPKNWKPCSCEHSVGGNKGDSSIWKSKPPPLSHARLWQQQSTRLSASCLLQAIRQLFLVYQYKIIFINNKKHLWERIFKTTKIGYFITMSDFLFYGMISNISVERNRKIFYEKSKKEQCNIRTKIFYFIEDNRHTNNFCAIFCS